MPVSFASANQYYEIFFFLFDERLSKIPSAQPR